MGKPLPQMPITPEHLTYLIAVMLVYQQYRQRKTPPTTEREHTLLVLTFLLPKLQRGIKPHEGELPLLLTVDEVHVMQSGLSMMLDSLKRKPASHAITQEITRLQQLKILFNQHFSITQD
jgi:hypothetical protein